MTVHIIAAGGACAATFGVLCAALRLGDGTGNPGPAFPLEISHEEYARPPLRQYARAERRAAAIRWQRHRPATPILAVADCWEIVLHWVIRAAQAPAPLYDEAAWDAWREHMEGAA